MVGLVAWATDVAIAAREAVVILPAAAGKVLSHCWVYRRGSCAGDTCLVVCSTTGNNIRVSRHRLISTLPVIGTSATKVQFGLVQGIFCQTQTELRVQFSQNAEPNLEVWSQVVWFGFQTLNSYHI